MDTNDIIENLRNVWAHLLNKMKDGNSQRMYQKAITYKVFWEDLEPDSAEAIKEEWETNWSRQFWNAAG